MKTIVTRIDLRAAEVELSAKVEFLRLERALHRAKLEVWLADLKADLRRWMLCSLGLQTLAVLGGIAGMVQMALP